MKTASSALIDFLATGGPFLICELYTFTLNGGFVARYTDCDVDIRLGNLTFSASGPLFERTKVSTKMGMEVQTMDVTVVADASQLLNGTPWLRAVRQGGLDGAYLKVERVYTDDFSDTSRGAVWVFGGKVAEVTRAGRLLADFTVRSRVEELSKAFPPESYQPGCRHTLYDTRVARCGLDKELFRVNSSAALGSTRSVINCALANPADWFALGSMTFLTGANAGVTRTVKSYSPGVLELALPLLADPVTGDTFKAYPGCDKTRVTCDVKFANLPNFGGQSFIPVPETVL